MSQIKVCRLKWQFPDFRETINSLLTVMPWLFPNMYCSVENTTVLMHTVRYTVLCVIQVFLWQLNHCPLISDLLDNIALKGSNLWFRKGGSSGTCRRRTFLPIRSLFSIHIPSRGSNIFQFHLWATLCASNSGPEYSHTLSIEWKDTQLLASMCANNSNILNSC